MAHENFTVRALRRQSGEIAVSVGPDGTSATRQSSSVGTQPIGSGDIRTFWPFCRPIVMALVAREKGIELYIDSQAFHIGSSELRIERRTVFPGVKRFLVLYAAEVRFERWYLWTDLFEDDFLGTADFCKYILELWSSKDRQLRFFYTSRALAAGQNIQEKSVRDAIEAGIASGELGRSQGHSHG